MTETIQTGITGNWTRVRPSFFRGLAKSLEYAEDKCFGIILQATVGRNRTWEKITWTRFCDLASVTRRRCEQAIAKLLGQEDESRPGVFLEGLIRSRKSVTGSGTEYAIAARPEGDYAGIAKCRGCGKTSEIDLDTEFIPVPHSFFTDLPKACDHGMYLIVKVIVERTMRWDKATKQIIVVPCEISIDEFRTMTGLERSEIIEDLKKVQASEFIKSERLGRSNWYWARPENFAKGQARAKREVKQPKVKRTKGETDTPQKQTQPIEPKQTIRPVEFVTQPCGVCRHCGCYGPVDLIPESQIPPRKPFERARNGPIGTPLSTFEPWTGFEKLKKG